MSNLDITVEGGKSLKLKTAGKYCDKDIVVTATGSTVEPEDLNAVLTEQETLIETLQETLKGKAAGDGQYEVWTITYTDGTVEEKGVVLL